MSRDNCDAVLATLERMIPPFCSVLDDLDGETLNRQPADHKMSIGQMALHSFCYMNYYMTGHDELPWQKVKWTCAPADYPLTRAAIDAQIQAGADRMRRRLREADDRTLEGAWPMPGGKVIKLGYICCRLLHHLLAHGMQMAYLRQIYQPEWSHGGNFGKMATALIEMPYHTTFALADQPADNVGF